MNFKILYKSMTYLIVPTFTVFFLVFCWFLDWEAFKSFMTNREGWAGFLRIFVVGLEILLVWYMYEKNMQELQIEEPEGNARKILTTARTSCISETIGERTKDSKEYAVYLINDKKFVVEAN